MSPKDAVILAYGPCSSCYIGDYGVQDIDTKREYIISGHPSVNYKGESVVLAIDKILSADTIILGLSPNRKSLCVTVITNSEYELLHGPRWYFFILSTSPDPLKRLYI